MGVEEEEVVVLRRDLAWAMSRLTWLQIRMYSTKRAWRISSYVVSRGERVQSNIIFIFSTKSFALFLTPSKISSLVIGANRIASASVSVSPGTYSGSAGTSGPFISVALKEERFDLGPLHRRTGWDEEEAEPVAQGVDERVSPDAADAAAGGAVCSDGRRITSVSLSSDCSSASDSEMWSRIAFPVRSNSASYISSAIFFGVTFMNIATFSVW